MNKYWICLLLLITMILPVDSASINAAAYRTMQIQQQQAYQQQRYRNYQRPTPYWQMQSNYNTRNRYSNSYSDYTRQQNYNHYSRRSYD